MSPIASSAMPTPSDAPLSPPLDSIAIDARRPSCPPDEARDPDADVRPLAPGDEVSSPSITADGDRDDPYTRPIQQPTPPVDSPCAPDEMVASQSLPQPAGRKREETQLQKAYRLMYDLEQTRPAEETEKPTAPYYIAEPRLPFHPPTPRTKVRPAESRADRSRD